MVSRAGLEPATTALKDQNRLIADLPPFGHRLGHNGSAEPSLARVDDDSVAVSRVDSLAGGVSLNTETASM